MKLATYQALVDRAERKSLDNQIKCFVKLAKKNFEADVQVRRSMLRELFAKEDEADEKEFAQKAVMINEEKVRTRYETLQKIKEENKRMITVFLEKKKIVSDIGSCADLFNAIREREIANVKICQKEQMLENDRKLKRQRDLDNFWAQVEKKNMQRFDAVQATENDLRRRVNMENKRFWDEQIREAQARREEDRRITAEDAKTMAKHTDELRLEKFDHQHRALPQEEIQYQQDLKLMIAETQKAREAEAHEQAEEHRRMIAELKRIEDQETKAARLRKSEFKKATLDYITYVRRVREMEAKMDQLRSDRINDLSRTDRCTHNSIQLETKRKAEIACHYYTELKRQVCEEYERRLRDEAVHKENKILENRFSREPKSRAEILEQRRQQREMLDKQIADLKIYRVKEEAEYRDRLKSAVDNVRICEELLDKYVKDSMDYLNPHGNWRILTCTQKQHMPTNIVPYAAGNSTRRHNEIPPSGKFDFLKKSSCFS